VPCWISPIAQRYRYSSVGKLCLVADLTDRTCLDHIHSLP